MHGSLLPRDIKPGMLHHLLNLLAEQTTNTKTYKLCLDGKKINSSTSSVLGDVDLFGYEQKPTLTEKQERRNVNSEISLTDELVVIIIRSNICRFCFGRAIAKFTSRNLSKVSKK